MSTAQEMSRQMARSLNLLESGGPGENSTAFYRPLSFVYLSSSNHSRFILKFDKLERCSQKQTIDNRRLLKTSRVQKQSRKRLPKRRSISLLNFHHSKHLKINNLVGGLDMARHTNGWVKLHRKAALGDINSNFGRGGLFSALLAMANIQASTVDWMGKPRKLNRGQIVTSLKELSELGKLDRKTISKHLSYLHSRETIKLEKSKNGVLITFINYEQYAGLDAEWSRNAPTSLDDGMDRSMDIGVPHNEELKNKRIKELKGPSLNFDFESLYQKYPRRIEKSEAIKRARQVIKTQQDFDLLSLAIDNYAKACANLKDETGIKHMSTFLEKRDSKPYIQPWRDWIEYKPKNNQPSDFAEF